MYLILLIISQTKQNACLGTFWNLIFLFLGKFQMAVGMSSQTFVSDTRDNMRVFYSIITRFQDLKYKDPCTWIGKWSLPAKNDTKKKKH